MSAAAEFVAEARADQFVAELVRRPAEVFDGGGDFGLLCGGELVGADGEVAVPGGLDDGSRESGVGERLACVVDVDGFRGGVLDESAAGELDAEVESSYDDAGCGQDEGDGGYGEPAAWVAHQVGCAAGEAVADAAGGRDSGDLRAQPDGLACDGELGEDAGDDERAEHRREDTDAERDAEAADGSGGEEEEESGGDEGGDVGVGDGAERVAEAFPQGGAQALDLAGRVLLPGSFEDEDVGVHGHADREDEPGEARQGEGGAQCGQGGVREESVAGQGDGREAAEEAVHDGDEECGKCCADDGGPGAGPDGFGAEGGADGALFDGLDGYGEGAAVDEQGQFAGLFGGEVPGDLRGSAGDAGAAGHARVDLWRRDDLVVEDDRDAAGGVAGRGARGLPGQAAPQVLALALEVNGHEPAVGGLLVEGRLRTLDVRAGECERAEAQVLSRLVGQDAFPGTFRQRLGLGCVLVGDAEDRVEGELGGATEDGGGFARVLDARKFDDDAVLAGAGDRGFGDTEGVHAAAQHLQGAFGGLGVSRGVE